MGGKSYVCTKKVDRKRDNKKGARMRKWILILAFSFKIIDEDHKITFQW